MVSKNLLASLFFSFTGAWSLTVPPPFHPSLFKDLNVTRNLVYHYYSYPADIGKPTLLLLHGFPSTSYDWRHQVSFFQDKGYGLIVPDMLGYGGTAKPIDPQTYASSLISKDIVDILDAEDIQQAILIGHDWGSKIVSRLANYYPQRFSSFAFLSVGYFPPEFSTPTYEELTGQAKSVLGYENFGYWDFFASDGADQIVLDNLDSLLDLMYTNNTVLTITDFAPLGAIGPFISSGRRVTPGDYVTPEERAIQIEALRQGKMTGPLNWYKIVRGSIERDDNQQIPQENLILQKPVFFGAALRDYVALAATLIASTLQHNNNSVTIHEYDSGHWVMMEARDQVNNDLLQWIEGLALYN